MTGGRSRHPAPEPTGTTTPAQAPIPAPQEIEGDTEADYQAAWKQFDPSLKSSITSAQFRQLMAGLGENVTDREVDELVNSIDDEEKISCEFPCFLDRM